MKSRIILIGIFGVMIHTGLSSIGIPLLISSHAELAESCENFTKAKNQPGPLLTDCTGFVFSDGQTVYAGGNEDFREKDFHIWFEPAANEDEYGSVFIGYPIWEGKYHAFHGMNTAGLYHDSFGGAQKELKGMK